MTVAGFFILLGIAVLIRLAGNRLAPVVMHPGRWLSLGVGWSGGFLGSLLDGWLWQLGPEVGGVNLVAAAVGCTLLLLLLGLYPFVRIMLGRL
jgi:hypothetical protein